VNMPGHNERTGVKSVRPAVIAGLFGALDAAFFLCRAPRPSVPLASSRELLARSFTYILVAALTGAAGSCLFWRRNKGGSFRPLKLVALSGATGSLWIPAVVLLFRQDSMWMAPVVAISAAVLALCWRPLVPVEVPDETEIDRTELFAETMQPIPRSSRGYWLAVGIYAACLALNIREIVTASALLAVCGYVVAWQLTTVSVEPASEGKLTRRATSRLLRTAIPALLVTFLALMAWNPNSTNGGGASAHDREGSDNDASRRKRDAAANSASGLSGYQSIVLWPLPDKKKFVMPPMPGITPNLEAISKPLEIPFDGSYWYFQPPRRKPGPEARIARGTPLAANIRSTDFMPLVMEAHEKLGAHVNLACCSALLIAIDSCDNLPGPISLGVSLNDYDLRTKGAERKRGVYLGSQPVTPSAPALFASSCVPRTQTLRYLIPHPAVIRKFNEVTVSFAGGAFRAEVGPKIAIKQFQLLPR